MKPPPGACDGSGLVWLGPAGEPLVQGYPSVRTMVASPTASELAPTAPSSHHGGRRDSARPRGRADPQAGDGDPHPAGQVGTLGWTRGLASHGWGRRTRGALGYRPPSHIQFLPLRLHRPGTRRRRVGGEVVQGHPCWDGAAGMHGALRTDLAVCAGVQRVLGAEGVPAVPGHAFCCRAPCKRLVNKADACPGSALPSPTSPPRGSPRGLGSRLQPGATNSARFRPKPPAPLPPPPRAWPPVRDPPWPPAMSRVLLPPPALLLPWAGTAPPFLLPSGGEVGAALRRGGLPWIQAFSGFEEG